MNVQNKGFPDQKGQMWTETFGSKVINNNTIIAFPFFNFVQIYQS